MAPGPPPLSAKSGCDGAKPLPGDVRDQLERILAYPLFAASARRKAFLRYLVEESLAGRTDRLKGFSIGVAVFGRPETFDPQADPVVRLEARRLRRDLDGYYITTGRGDPVRISIPKGSYAPHIECRRGDETSFSALPAVSNLGIPAEAEVAGEESTLSDCDTLITKLFTTAADDTGSTRGTTTGRSSRRVLAALVGMAIFATAAGVWIWNGRRQESSATTTVQPQEHGPLVIVLPFEALSSSDDDRYFASGMTQQLIADLMRFSALRLYSAPASFRQSSSADPVDLKRSLGVAYVVKGSIRSGGGTSRVNAQLVDATTGRLLWSETYDRELTSQNLLGVQDDLAGQLATRLADPYGMINDAAAVQLRGQPPRTMFAYRCVLRAYTYRVTFSTELYPSTRACLEEAVRVDPEYADALALLGWLHLDAARYRFVPERDAAGEMEQARILAERAVELAPKQPLSLQALSAVNYYRGEFDKAERLQRQALALNPNDPEAMAQLGWRLSFRGRFDEGLGYLRRAIERSPSPPAWYHTSLAMHAYLQGNYAEALVEAEQTRVTFSGIGLALYAMTQAALGNHDEAKKALDELAVRVPHFVRDPAAALRIHQIDESIIDRLVEGLRKASWTEPNSAAAAAKE